jgi:phosphatidylglycerol:prolipoprotein diacylglycerol transferase
MIDFTPNPIALQLGPLSVHWYGIAYAVGLAVAYAVISREARWQGLDTAVLGNGMIVVAIAALVGGRLYHVIDQWQLYRDDLLKIVLPPYSGLGVYGGIIAGTIAAFLYARRTRQPFLRWADAVAPGLFAMQAIGRLGNFFNQELYGAPTDLPWGIAIQCQYRTQGYACPPGSDPVATLSQHFQPLFLYESISGLVGALALIWLARRYRERLHAGDLLLVFFVWYGSVRFVLESFKTANWLFFGIPTAQLVSVLLIAPALALLIWRHRPGHPHDDPPLDVEPGPVASASPGGPSPTAEPSADNEPVDTLT